MTRQQLQTSYSQSRQRKLSELQIQMKFDCFLNSSPKLTINYFVPPEKSNCCPPKAGTSFPVQQHDGIISPSVKICKFVIQGVQSCKGLL